MALDAQGERFSTRSHRSPSSEHQTSPKCAFCSQLSPPITQIRLLQTRLPKAPRQPHGAHFVTQSQCRPSLEHQTSPNVWTPSNPPINQIRSSRTTQPPRLRAGHGAARNTHSHVVPSAECHTSLRRGKLPGPSICQPPSNQIRSRKTAAPGESLGGQGADSVMRLQFAVILQVHGR